MRAFWAGAVLMLVACAGNNTGDVAQDAPATSPPPSATTAQQRLSASTRHGEWVTVKTSATDSVRAYLVFPENKAKAPVVVVIHEIFGLSNWVRGVADQLAADG